MPTPVNPPLGGPLFNLHGGEGWSICQGQIIYLKPDGRRAENFKFYYMCI